jgi:flagellar basal-body rod protein FlgC
MGFISSLALSGLNAASMRLRVSASNLANARDSAPLPGSGVAGPAPFVPTRVSTISLGANGVQAQLSAAQPASTPTYDPSSPYADASGMTASPNVDPSGVAIETMLAAQQYRASAALLKVNDQMQRSALDMFS